MELTHYLNSLNLDQNSRKIYALEAQKLLRVCGGDLERSSTVDAYLRGYKGQILYRIHKFFGRQRPIRPLRKTVFHHLQKSVHYNRIDDSRALESNLRPEHLGFELPNYAMLRYHSFRDELIVRLHLEYGIAISRLKGLTLESFSQNGLTLGSSCIELSEDLLNLVQCLSVQIDEQEIVTETERGLRALIQRCLVRNKICTQVSVLFKSNISNLLKKYPVEDVALRSNRSLVELAKMKDALDR